MASQSSFLPRVFGRRRSSAVNNPPAWRAALIFLGAHLGGFANAFAAEFGARCAINHLWDWNARTSSASSVAAVTER